MVHSEMMNQASPDIRSISLASYIWPIMRSSVLVSWLLLTSISLVAYVSITAIVKANSLKSSLEAANRTISEAIDVGDWDFVLSILKGGAAVGQIFELRLTDPSGTAVHAGPLGEPAFGAGDNGPGIPIELLRSVGQRGLRSGKTNGSGLGLYHAKQKVFEWQGDFIVQSAEGTGTLVQMKLPIATCCAQSPEAL
jgi:hypothetical protein